jgi:hypothetical protein
VRTSNSVGLWITASLGLAILAACSIGGSRSDPTTFEQATGAPPASSLHRSVRHSLTAPTPSFMDSKAAYKPLVFVAGAVGNFVDIFLQDHHNKQVGQITGLATPGGLATDAVRDLYVVNEATSNVPVYSPPYTGAPVMTLDDTANCPAGPVAISPKGVVAIMNYSAKPCAPQGPGNVSFYAKNSTTACETLVADPSIFSYVYGSAFDHAGNLYITGGAVGSNYTVLGEIKGGCSAKTIKVLSTTNTINTAYGIQIDKAGRIAVLDSYDISYPFSYIYTYNPPIKGSLGAPVSTTSLDVQNETTSFAFLASGKGFYATELGGMSTDYVDQYDYPAGGAPEQIITVGGGGGQLYATAVTPPLIP